MRVTRSATSSAGSLVESTAKRPAPAAAPRDFKRTKSASAVKKEPAPPPSAEDVAAIHEAAVQSDTAAEAEGVLMHPKLSFSFADARRHLISIDTRWQPLIDGLKCTPFQEEQETAFNPFRSLVSSIIGQQVSWLAARAIQRKFTRLFFPQAPSAPEGSSDSKSTEETPFPTPAQVVKLERANPGSLRGAGLSGRKVEYILELAERFSDGRLSAKQLWESSDEEIMKDLCAVRGIGPWTVHMFLIFSGRRPDVCPPGDLGIQRALCKWYVDDPHNSSLVIHARKLQQQPKRESTPPAAAVLPAGLPPSTPLQKPLAPQSDTEAYPTPSSPNVDSLPTSIKQEQLHTIDEKNPFVWPETSNDLTIATLKSRLNGKKLKGNLYLSPQETVELMEPFRPYRSIACFYLWALSDGTGDP